MEMVALFLFPTRNVIRYDDLSIYLMVRSRASLVKTACRSNGGNTKLVPLLIVPANQTSGDVCFRTIRSGPSNSALGRDTKSQRFE